ncbi:MAG: energy transducer TonB, partial [Bacteroidales bacterium]|nr:energy transducer TonB [Bacteroidales bacterium]
DKSNAALKYLWARERIRILDDYTNLAQNEAHVDEFTALGLKYNLLTAYTSFIAIDSEIRNQDGNMTTIKQPLPLPEGVSNYAIGAPTSRGGVFRKGGNSMKLGSARTEYMALEIVESEMDYDEPTFVTLESSPEFKGGEDALMKFIEKHLVFPEEAKENGISGTVYVEFIVNEDGTLEDILIIRSVSKSLDDEAIRVIKLTSGKWKSGEQNGKSVKASMIVPVKFKL